MAKHQTSQDEIEQFSDVEDNTQILTVEDKAYDLEKLSDEARQMLVNVQAAEHELRELDRKAAIAQTAHAAYMSALKEALPEPLKAEVSKAAGKKK
ncbi:MAG: DUF6447 family protein [Halomonas sp.]|uniref:DUF6447 family protein n=1 Tax=Halomonas sp. TaxID=1486246 RepID=UPI003F929EE3